MKIIVTGGAGFIGSNLIDALLQSGHSVTCLDNFSTGKHENLALAKDNPNFELIEGDIRDLVDCQRACEGVEIVLHQAAMVTVPGSIEDPIRNNEINIDGTLNMLVAARDAGIKRFVYATSSAVYGDNTDLPIKESAPIAPLSPYGLSKYVNELYALNFGQLFGMETIGLRYFNVFGPRQDPSGAYAGVISKFMDQFVRHEAPTINGDGSFSRDFVYIDDVVTANILAATTNNREAINQVYNIASGKRTSLNELVETVQKSLSELDPAILAVEPKHGPERAGDIPHSHADIKKAKESLGYSPTFSFQQGIQRLSTRYFNSSGALI